MTTPLRPLRVFIYQTQTEVDSWSIQPSHPGLLSNSSSVKDQGSKLSQDPKSDGNRSSEERLFLETAYGLQLTVINCGDTNITADASTEVGQRHGVETQRRRCQYHYRLFPDWQTSYLWYDTRSSHNPPDEIHVDEDIIEARCPTLAPFYFAWQDIYENSFTAQGCDRGSGLDVFPDIGVRVGWEVEGLLIACWLVLQDDVEQVKYEPATGMYLIKKDNLGDILRQFLTDMDALL